jgi:hypothetical protein
MDVSFWNDPHINISYFYKLKTYTDNIVSLYDDYTLKWSNNQTISEDFSYFFG